MEELYQFLLELEQNNNREWFDANRPRYLALRRMWTDKIQEIIDALAKYDPSLRYVRAADCLYRINRDIRFSKDKSIYKTFFSALISPAGRKWDLAGYYVHFGTDESLVYAGLWCPEQPVLKKLRRAIVDNIDEFRSITETPDMKRLYPDWTGEKLKTAPKGYDRNDPNIDLLRLTEYGKYYPLDRRFFDDPSWPVKAAELLKYLTPMVDFLNYSIREEV